jgi:hypothetical protein
MMVNFMLEDEKVVILEAATRFVPSMTLSKCK